MFANKFREFFTVLSLLILVSCAVAGRSKRNSESFFRVLNDTDAFLCVSTTANEYMAKGIPRIHLNDQQKLQLLHKLSGDFVSSIMFFPGQSSGIEDRRNVLAQGARCSSEEIEANQCYNRSQIIALLHEEQKTGKRDSNLPFYYVLPPSSLNDESNGVVADYCVERSKPYFKPGPSEPGVEYLRMCKVCSITKYRPPSEWPPVVFESVCDPNELGCLYEGNSVNGKCQQAELTFDLLRADPNLCEIVTVDGKTVMTEKWSLHQEELRTGCECGIISRSGETPRFT